MSNAKVQSLLTFIHASPQIPTCEDFASVMGFQEAQNPIYGNLDEIEKFLASCYLLRKLRSRVPNEIQLDAFYFKFSALHLSSLVNGFLETPLPPAGCSEELVQELRINNSYIEMLGAVSHSPYFIKFCRSRLPSAEGGKQLMKVIAQRLVDIAPTFDRKMLHPPPDREEGYYQSAAATSIQMLSTLLATFIKEPEDSPVRLSPEVKAALLPWLKKWEKRHSKEILGIVSSRTRNQIEEQASLMKDARQIRRTLKNWYECGKPGCTSTSNLKACSRCQTVCYCCSEHQKIHWADTKEPHKALCFKTEY